jgi:DNA-binding transcriptional regulator YhcF (GntR family)
MEFKENPAIYIQIAEYVCEQILVKKWNLGDKIISIRDLAIKMEVNPNTVQRAYDFLQQKDIITNKRGVGFFIEEDAMDRILGFRREQFMENELPVFMRNMYLLKIDFKEIKSLFEQFVQDNFKNKL